MRFARSSRSLDPVRPLMLAAAMLAAALPAVTAAAGTIRHDRADSSYTGLASNYPSVGKLTWPGYICSGTLIDSDWVLTAGHCVDGGSAASSYTFSLADSGGGSHAGSQIYIHPEWTGSLSNGHDIALLKLATAEATVTPATLNRDSNETGRTGTHVGYGKTGTGSTGDTGAAGTKRAGDNMVDLTGASVSGYDTDILFDDFDNPSAPADSWSGSSTPLNLEYMIAGGDSGGGMFIDFGSGPVVAGVHSFIASVDGVTNADYGDISGSTRVSAFAGWIDGVMGASEPVVPEPGTVVVWSIFGAALVWWSRRT